MTSQTFYLRYLNPLAGLDEYRLISLFDEGERGAYATLQWLYRFLEKRNPTARAVKRRLLSALGKLQWDIKTVDAGDDAAKKTMAEAQAKTLRAAYDRLTNLRGALNHLASADLRGFAHVEKIYGGSLPGKPESGDPNTITELRVVEQWFWVRDGLYGVWAYNAGAKQGVTWGQVVDLTRFIVREVDDPANEIIAKLHVRQEASDADWDGYLERFGIPTVFIEGPPNVPPEKEAEYQRTAEQIASNASGYIPNGAKPHTVAPGTGSSVFKERLDYLDGQIVIAATSGKLTILAESGAGTLAGAAQKDAFDEIAQAIANNVSEAMQRDFDADILAAAHPGEPVLAYFEYAAVDEKDGSKALDDAGKANAAGYEMDETELSEKSGYKLKRFAPGILPPGNNNAQQPSAGAPAPQTEKTAATPPAESATPAPDPAASAPLDATKVKTATAAQLGVTPEYLAPAEDALQQLITDAQDGELTNEELLARGEELLKSLPGLAQKMDVTGIAAALEKAMQDAAEKAVQP